ncbi:MAG TPA: hypothetical protein VKQ73_05580 [Stellaceae bacterium]|nr:hypothetical protein [Stellaceae bacterium]
MAVTTVRMLRLGEGLYSLRVGELAGAPSVVGGMAVPAAQIGTPLGEESDEVEIVAAFPGSGPWLGREGGTVILRSPPGGGFIIVSLYDAPGRPPGNLALDLQRLAGPEDGEAEENFAERTAAPASDMAPALPNAPGATRDVATEILLHIERAGDRLFPGRGWVGALGRRMRIEAFSIRPVEGMAPAEIELKGFLPNGQETPWIPGGVLCGTRGRGLPLTGFAVRVVPQRADRFEVVYQGSFFAGGISALHRNGEPCQAASPDDPLEAINVRLIDRSPEHTG